jgi:hypothetical protein
MDNTIIQQGRFTSTGANVTLQLRADVDWLKVYNYTQFANGTGTGQVVAAIWQRGMSAGTGLVYTKTATTLAAIPAALSSGGFTLVDSSVQTPGALNATITAISNAAIPVVSNSGTNGLVAGDVVRIIDVTSAKQLGGIDFTVGYNTLTSGTFSLDYMAQIVAGTTGSWRKINFNPIFYPRRRVITKITKASSAVVTLSVTHGYKVGQAVRFQVPEAFGMVEMNGLLGTITAIDTTTTSGNSITVDIDSSAFTTFAWPTSSNVAFTPAEVIPVGEDTAEALSAATDILSDATINESYIGMVLGGGAGGPAGASSDVIYWQAGKSFSVSNS